MREADDPLLYRGCAAHYLRGRPPYSSGLGDLLAAELGLDGSGRLLDVGCGPGVLAVQLAAQFEDVIGVDPDPDMLAEAERHARSNGVVTASWHQARAEDLATLDVGHPRVVTFGQSFHWTDRQRVATVVHDLLVPGGALVAVAHDIEARPERRGAPPADPPIPHDAIESLVASYLGADFRSQSSTSWLPQDRLEPAIAQTCFGAARTVYAPGEEGLTRNVDYVISGYLSTSFAAPHRFGARLADFVDDARSLLMDLTESGRFSDWPGDTAVIIATRPD